MKKAIQINLGGRHFHIDEDAYILLKEYTDSLRSYFKKDAEGGTEIIDDIEQRMAELLEGKISDRKEVVTLDDVKETIEILGKIEDFEFGRVTTENNSDYENLNYDRKTHRRLYRDPDDSYLGGVCGGLGAYFNIDPMWLRIIFIALIFANGFGLALYAILWIVVPKAHTTAQKLQMKGEPVTVQNIQRSINEEYQKVKSNVKNFSKSEGFKRSRDAVGEIFHAIGKVFVFFGRFIVYIIGFAFLIAGIILLLGLGTAFFARFHWFHHIEWPHIYLPNLSDFFADPTTASIVGVCLVILIAIPVISLIVGGIKLLLNIRGHSRLLNATALTAWILALIVLVVMVITEGETFAFRTSSSKTSNLKPVKGTKYYLKLNENEGATENITVYSIFDHDFYYDRYTNEMLGKPTLKIVESNTDIPQLIVIKSLRNMNVKNTDDYMDEVRYDWMQNDSLLILDEYFRMDGDYKWRFPEIDLLLKIPENSKIYVSPEMEEILGYSDMDDNYSGKWDLPGKTWVMTEYGLKNVGEN